MPPLKTEESPTVSTGISLPADIMQMLDKQASAKRLKRSTYIGQLVIAAETQARTTKTRQPVNA